MAHRTSSEVAIVGAGIAGLTAAAALDKFGVDVQVIERASALTEAGTALSIWPNALAALERLGLREGLSEIGIPEPAPVARDASGQLILGFHQDRLGEDPASRALIVRRSDLQALLLDAVSALPIRLRAPAERVVQHEGSAEVVLVDGTSIRAKVVLACDGIRSVARPLFSNPPLTYRHRTSWRAVVEDAGTLVPVATLTVGEGKQFIAGRLRDGSAYWAADVGLPEGVNGAIPDRRRYLRGVFSAWHDPIPQLIEQTRSDQLVIADLYDFVPRQLAAGSVALLGDAGHPMTPDLGQGACLAIEDAVVLAECMELVADPVMALSTYESLRLPRVRRLVRGSRRLGQLATTKSTLLANTRNLAGRHLPLWVNRRIMSGVASESAFVRTLPVQ